MDTINLKRVIPSVLNAHRANINPNTAKKRVVSVMLVHFHRQVVLRFVNPAHSEDIKRMQAVHRVFVAYPANTNHKKETRLAKIVAQVNI